MERFMEQVVLRMFEDGFERLPSFPLKLDGEIHRFSTSGNGLDGWYSGFLTRSEGADCVQVRYGDSAKGIEGIYSSRKLEKVIDPFIEKGAYGMTEPLTLKTNNEIIDENCSTLSKAPAHTKQQKKRTVVPTVGPGIIADIVGYYNATSIQKRPGFALQTALAFCSIILGRKYKTEFNHHPSLYFLNIGRSGSGKEHQITVIQNLLEHTKQESLLGASGYTSPGAIATALLESPAHITLIDEFGDYLISLNDKKSSQRLVNRCLLQLFGRCNGSYIGEQYSKFSKVTKGDEKVIIKNPALTLLAAVQPSKFYSNVNDSLINDGFLGRFITYECEEANEAVHLKKRDKVSCDKFADNIREWVDIVNKRFSNPTHYMSGTDPSVSPEFVSIRLDDDALAEYNEFSDYVTNELIPKLDEFNANASEIVSRWPYMSGSVSLITALSRDPNTSFITKDDVQYAIKVIKSFGERFVENLLNKINTSQYEQDKNEFLSAIRACGKTGISARDLNRKKPFYRFTRRDRFAILDDLLESELIATIQIKGLYKNVLGYYAVD